MEQRPTDAVGGVGSSQPDTGFSSPSSVCAECSHVAWCVIDNTAELMLFPGLVSCKCSYGPMTRLMPYA